jgi:hypothetical protein
MDLEPKHNEAIREEIGARLHILMHREQPNMPDHLRQLLQRLNETDHSFKRRLPQRRTSRGWLGLR